MEAAAESMELVARGMMERNLALFPGWQLGPQRARRRVERRDFLGVIARADRAPLGEAELDVLTWLSSRWYEQGRAQSGRVAFTFYELAQALYGTSKVGGRNNEIIRDALDNLHAVVITLSGVNVLTGAFERTFQSKVHILRTLVVSEQLQMLSQGGDAGAVGGLRGSTIEVQLEDWLVAQLDGQVALQLDWALQRRLSGLAKRLWLYLVAEESRFALSRDGVERLEVPLTRDVFGALGIECVRDRDNRAALRRAATRLCEQDGSYAIDVLKPARGRELWRMLVQRSLTPAVSQFDATHGRAMPALAEATIAA